MELKDFIGKFVSQFEEEDPAILKLIWIFMKLDSWSSLTSLSVVAMVYQEYGVELDTQDVRNADTIEDLFNIVKERKA